MKRNRHHNRLRELIYSKLESFTDPERTPVVVDPPSHANVGDSAIYIGELEFLKRKWGEKNYPFIDLINYSKKNVIRREDILFLHGGGNFGDIWPRQHEFRLEILNRFSDSPIVQFPQSVRIADPKVLEDTKAAIGKHPNFTLFVRDTNSQKFAEANFDCETILCPDMAYAMSDMKRGESDVDTLVLSRTDKEKLELLDEGISGLSGSVDVVDWIAKPNTPVYFGTKLFSSLHRYSPIFSSSLSSANNALRSAFCNERVAVGVSMLSRGQRVVSDRLHAHIICTILEIPHVALDTLDGKVRAFYQCWNSELDYVRFCDDPAKISESVRELY